MPRKGIAPRVDLGILRQKRSMIEGRLTAVSLEPIYSRRAAIQLANEHGAGDMTENILTYMHKNRVISPSITPGDGRDTFRYGRAHISDMILVHNLRKEEHLTYTQILNLLNDDRGDRMEPPSFPVVRSDVGVPTQQRRSLALLRSRVMGVILTWMLDHELPVNLVIHARRMKYATPGLPRGQFNVISRGIGLKEADRHVGQIKSDDLLGYVTIDREVIFPQHNCRC